MYQQRELEDQFESSKEDVNFKYLSERIEASDLKEVKAFLKKNNNLIDAALWIAAKFGQFKLVQTLLKEKTIHPDIRNNIALRTACAVGHLPIVILLLNHKNVDPRDFNFGALWAAAENDHSGIIELLLRIIYNENDNRIFMGAIKRGHTNVVKILIYNKKVNIDSLDYPMLCLAVKNGHIGLVNYLLSLKINVVPGKNSLVKRAIDNGHKEMVEVLLADPRIIPDFHHLQYAVKKGQIEILRYLIIKEDVGLHDYETLLNLAAKFGYYEMFKYLLEVSNLDPSNSRAFFWACIGGNLNIVQLLMQCASIDSKDISLGISKALEHNYAHLLKFLLKIKEVNLDIDCLLPGITKAFENDYQDIIHQFITSKKLSIEMAFSIFEQLEKPLCKTFVFKCYQDKVLFWDKIYAFFRANRKILPHEVIGEISKTTLDLYEQAL